MVRGQGPQRGCGLGGQRHWAGIHRLSRARSQGVGAEQRGERGFAGHRDARAKRPAPGALAAGNPSEHQDPLPHRPCQLRLCQGSPARQGLRLHHEAGGPPAAQGPGFGGRAGGAVGAETGGLRGPLEGPHRQDAGLSSRTDARLLAQCAGQRPQPGADRQLVDRPRGAAAGARLGAARGPLGGRVRGRRHPPGRGPGQLRALRPAQPGAIAALWRLSSQGPGSGKPAAPLHLAGGCGAQAAPSLRGPVRQAALSPLLPDRRKREPGNPVVERSPHEAGAAQAQPKPRPLHQLRLGGHAASPARRNPQGPGRHPAGRAGAPRGPGRPAGSLLPAQGGSPLPCQAIRLQRAGLQPHRR